MTIEAIATFRPESLTAYATNVRATLPVGSSLQGLTVSSQVCPTHPSRP